ncbi:hypothetical protein GGE67_006428, partial [Rhizobium leucaenae]|nr:hypothetical protein [Rhizobium leucaenae]
MKLLECTLKLRQPETGKIADSSSQEEGTGHGQTAK